MNKILLAIIALLVLPMGMSAQTAKVRGTVIDDAGPIIGATVRVQGTSIATVTDFDGNFVLNDVPNVAKASLKVSYIGMVDAVKELGGKTEGIIIKMKEDMSELEDVVVIGYGTMKRANLTGSVASVSGKALEKVPVASVGEAIQGRLPGVQVTTADGSPDAEITIRVRGGGSLTQDNSPLILVDGFEVDGLNDIPPTDVESIEVLKDAASTAIYGARGANGVILVTTKKPGEGKVNINLNTYVQTKELSNTLDVMDPYEYVMAQYEYYRMKSSNPTAFFNKYGQASEYYIYQGYEGYDWQDEIFGSHPIAYYTDLSISGGGKQMKYKLTYIHQDQPSVMEGNGLVQNNINGQINAELFDFLSLEYRTKFTHKKVSGSGTDGVSLITALQQAPTEGLDDFMQLPEDDTYYDSDSMEEITLFDPVEEAALNYRLKTTKTYNQQIALSWKIMKGLTLRNEFGYQTGTVETRRYYGLGTSTAKNNDNLPVVSIGTTESKKWQLTNTLSYNFNLKQKHDFQAMIGQEIKNSESKTKTYGVRYFPETTTASKAFDNLGLGTAYSATSSYGSPVRVSSFFGRLNYSYDDRYLATLTARADGSSKFSENNRWGFFPALAVAWRMSNEAFLKDVNWLSNLKLRLSIGTSGNDRIDSDLYTKYYGISNSRSAGWGETSRYYYSFYNSSYPVNEDVKWETTITRNIGLDFGLFNQRISGSLDIYWNTVKDLLVESTIPGYTGYSTMMTNVGQTSNRGIELQLQAYLIEKKDFSLSVNFNIGKNKNKIDKLASGENEWQLQSGVSELNADDYRAYVGSTIGLIYGYVNDGFYTIDDFDYFDSSSNTWHLKDGVVDCTILSGTPEPGNAKFKKLTDVDESDPDTYVLTSDDRTVIGNTTPKFSGGFGVNMQWKSFDLSAFFNFMYGFDVYNYNKILLTTWADNSYNNLLMDVSSTNRWRIVDDMGNYVRYDPEALAALNENATIWRPTSISSVICMSYAIEDGSFLRLNTLSLGYTLPYKLTSKLHINKCRFYATGYNLFTITGYSGYDPEVDIATGLTPNIDNNRYPRSRTYTVGVQLSF